MPAIGTAENPLAASLERLPVRPTTLHMFGATGDLAQHKLVPALYNLAHEGALPERFNLIGVALDDLTTDEFRTRVATWVKSFSRTPPDDDVLRALLERTHYVSGKFDDHSVYERLIALGRRLDDEAGTPLDRVHYFSTAPVFFELIVGQLGRHGLNRHEGADVRV